MVSSSERSAASALYYDEELSPKVFVFPGQGAQFLRMGEGLFAFSPSFRASVERCFDAFQQLMEVDFRKIFFSTADNACLSIEYLRDTSIVQPLLFTIEYAMAHELMRLNVRPDVLLGHSLGELVAAAVSDVFTLDDAIAVIATRARLMAQAPRGAMLAVNTNWETLEPWVSTSITPAAFNSPNSCVVAGTVHEVEALHTALATRRIASRLLPSLSAFHTSMMKDASLEFEAFLRTISCRPPQIPFISNVTGDFITDAQASSPRYWAQQMVRPVQFSRGVKTLANRGSCTYIEVGPGNALGRFVRNTLVGECLVLIALLVDDSKRTTGQDNAQRQWDQWRGELAKLGVNVPVCGEEAK